MKLGLSTLLFVKSTIEDAVRATAELGADYIEVIYDMPHFPPGFDPKSLGGLKQLIDSHGLGVSIHGSFWDLNAVSHYPSLRQLIVSQTKDAIEACQVLEGDVVSVHPGFCHFKEVEALLEEAKRFYREFIAKCQPYAQERGVVLAVENTSTRASCPYTADELEELMKDFEGLRLTLDVAHAYLAARRQDKPTPEDEVIRMIQRFKDRLSAIHLHDNRGRWDEHLPPGEGEIDFKPIVKALKEVDYRGPLIVELWDPENPREAGSKGLSYTRKLLHRK
jgi:sugar phosphate isomerase/epimerase